MHQDASDLMRTYLNLTRRQREVLYWAQQGFSNPDIARMLCIAPSVVAGHLTNVYAELSAYNGYNPDFSANRYTLIRLFTGFFEQYPEMIPASASENRSSVS